MINKIKILLINCKIKIQIIVSKIKIKNYLFKNYIKILKIKTSKLYKYKHNLKLFLLHERRRDKGDWRQRQSAKEGR